MAGQLGGLWLHALLHSLAGTVAHLTDKDTEDPCAQLDHIGSILAAKALSVHSLVNEVVSSPLQFLSFCLGNG